MCWLAALFGKTVVEAVTDAEQSELTPSQNVSCALARNWRKRKLTRKERQVLVSSFCSSFTGERKVGSCIEMSKIV